MAKEDEDNYNKERDIAKLISVIQPRYAQNPSDVLRALKDAKTVLEKSIKEGEKAKLNISKALDAVKEQASLEHKLIYDSTSDQLEPIYFWILDFMQDSLGFKVEKLVDNFAASPAGGFFSEVGAKATKMQEEGMKIMATVNTIIRSIINLIYDLKDFEIRLSQYVQLESKDKKVAEAALLALKQIWLDKVDMQRGRGSIHQMTYELGFTTLRDAFFVAQTLEDVDKLDLNDRVKRALKPRIAEFFEWKSRSFQELKKRFQIERTYLKSQVSALRLYTRWAKPYLKAAEELSMRAGGYSGGRVKTPHLVNAFNTMLLELTILGKKEYKPAEEVVKKQVPPSFKNLKGRTYYGCVLVSFKFRGIPYRTPQGHYIFGGKTEVSWKAYALNSDELKVLEKELNRDDLATALGLVEEVTDNSLGELTKDIEHFLEGKEGEIDEAEKKEGKKPKKELDVGTIPKDSFQEAVFRAYIEKDIASPCFKIYDIFKKSRGMASYDEPDWETEELQRRMYNRNWKG